MIESIRLLTSENYKFMLTDKVTTIAFDADDTLWANMTDFQEAEQAFGVLLSDYLSPEQLSEELYKTEMQNLELYGYGAKGFMLCMMETASRVTQQKASLRLVDQIISIGQELIQKPVKLLNGVTDTLEELNGRYRLIVATKGDLLDQERKLKKSGIEHYFHHIEIMSQKKVSDYQKLLRHLDCKPQNFLMVGNSVKSDVLPVIETGAFAAHVPYFVTWQHEQQEQELIHPNYFELTSIHQILNYLS